MSIMKIIDEYMNAYVTKLNKIQSNKIFYMENF